MTDEELSLVYKALAYSEIWNILLKFVSPTRRGDYGDRLDFVTTQLRGCTEYRFCGSLGFGGKFWNTNGRWYVNCYQEDETPERKKMIKDCNVELAEFKSKCDGLRLFEES